MVRHVGVHRADDADVVDARGGMREQLAHLDAALAVALKLERRREGGAGLALGRQVGRRQRLAGELVEHRLGVKGIDVRWPTVHEQMDDALGLTGKMRRLGRQRGIAAHAIWCQCRAHRQGTKQVCEAQHPEAHPATAKEIAPGKKPVG